MKSLKFNSIKKPWIYLLKGRQKAPFAAMRRNTITVMGMPGAHLTSTEIDPIVIRQPVGFVVNDDEHELQIKDELASWLYTEEPVPLEFDDEPGRTYYAVVQNTLSDFEKFAELRQGTVEFLILDPYGYGPEETETFTADTTMIINPGTAPADPIFELEVLQPVTFAMISNGDQYNMIGEPLDVESQSPFQKYERVFHSSGNNLTGWTTASAGEVDGIIAGEMTTDGSVFKAADYGTGESWHGPAIRATLPSTLKNFCVEAKVKFMNGDSKDIGRVEVYMLDAVGNQICKMALKDTVGGRSETFGEARVGNSEDNEFLISKSNNGPDHPWTWNEFEGVLRIERDKDLWTAYIAKVDPVTGKHHSRRSVSMPDYEGKYLQSVAQVVVHVAQNGDYQTPVQAIDEVSVYKINLADLGIPYIADAGDTITFDHESDELLINGENFKSRHAFGGQFFELESGNNQLVVHPESSFNASVKYRPRYR
ncbi:hypothetical protein JNUCC1_03361 [Lentibacillus sp. JNUCC-1]|uniref:distal tail protein Dit n=1 Tax=Lentibacillus sp. JNUCC-1 TaxID=2654513 RepID=UPI0012E92FF2|nr:distal tail protein Dit [Lentibacillus sp. JNUCC-1]MUV39483.1 hypothetical protein [Lentibacillus sp. JNUCC-1]